MLRTVDLFQMNHASRRLDRLGEEKLLVVRFTAPEPVFSEQLARLGQDPDLKVGQGPPVAGRELTNQSRLAASLLTRYQDVYRVAFCQQLDPLPPART